MKQVAYHIERDLLQCNHWDEADKWLTERYIQHNPLVTSGRAGVVKFFGSRPKSATCDNLNAPVVVGGWQSRYRGDRVGSQGLDGADIYNNVVRHVADLGG